MASQTAVVPGAMNSALLSLLKLYTVSLPPPPPPPLSLSLFLSLSSLLSFPPSAPLSLSLALPLFLFSLSLFLSLSLSLSSLFPQPRLCISVFVMSFCLSIPTRFLSSQFGDKHEVLDSCMYMKDTLLHQAKTVHKWSQVTFLTGKGSSSLRPREAYLAVFAAASSSTSTSGGQSTSSGITASISAFLIKGKKIVLEVVFILCFVLGNKRS